MLLQPNSGLLTYVVWYQTMTGLFDFGILAVLLTIITALRMVSSRRAAER